VKERAADIPPTDRHRWNSDKCTRVLSRTVEYSREPTQSQRYRYSCLRTHIEKNSIYHLKQLYKYWIPTPTWYSIFLQIINSVTLIKNNNLITSEIIVHFVTRRENWLDIPCTTVGQLEESTEYVTDSFTNYVLQIVHEKLVISSSYSPPKGSTRADIASCPSERRGEEEAQIPVLFTNNVTYCTFKTLDLHPYSL